MDRFDFKLLKLFMNVARRPVLEVIVAATVDGLAAIVLHGSDGDVMVIVLAHFVCPE